MNDDEAEEDDMEIDGKELIIILNSKKRKSTNTNTKIFYNSQNKQKMILNIGLIMTRQLKIDLEKGNNQQRKSPRKTKPKTKKTNKSLMYLRKK